MNRNTLTFEANVPYELALKYESGREISNGRIMFTTTQNECFFLDPEDARKIHALGLTVNEPFRIVKRFVGKKTVYDVSRIQEPRQAHSGKVAPAPAPQEATSKSAPHNVSADSQLERQLRDSVHVARAADPQQERSLSLLMASSYIAAIDAVILAEEYARHKALISA